MDMLEEAVKRAMNEIASRPEFYRVFLESQLVVPHGNAPGELQIENGRLSVGATLKLPSIPADGQNWIPVFSSTENLSRAIREETPHVQLLGRDFLALVKGAHVVLNPGGFGKQLLPDEIDAMLSGAIFHDNAPRKIVTTKPEQILLAQPAKYPTALVTALKSAFAGDPAVKAAYLAHGFMPSVGAEPHTMIGIDADNYEAIVVKIGPVVKSALAQNEIVDFVSIRTGGAIAAYMLKDTKPFYQRTSASPKTGFLKRWLGN